ncbi:MAG TPA: hypothetical protein GX707_00295 [Epulopiscium sp.]|nr:hypothetical protein [Candidatus Epulonipiscium sp.]
MDNLMTRDDVNEMDFYEMPKAFFEDPRYMSMRSESKIAYMLMYNLLALSEEKNQVNKNGELYVKFSRDTLMRELNIKGNQKAAQVMKELVDHELIVCKRVGLTQCNEIYLRDLKG